MPQSLLETSFDPSLIVVAASLLIAAFVKGMTAMGFPLIATPMLTLILDIRMAISILVIPNILMDLGQATRTGFPRQILRRFRNLLVMTVVGVFLGTNSLVALPIWILNLSLGVMVLIFVGSHLTAIHYDIPPKIERVLSPVVGFVAGFLNGMTNVAGPLLAIYLFNLRLSKREFVQAISTIFIINKCGQLVAITAWSLLTLPILAVALSVTVFVIAGFYLGLKAQDRVKQGVFNAVILAFISVFGMVLIVRALGIDVSLPTFLWAFLREA